jgi:hypothetical protein
MSAVEVKFKIVCALVMSKQLWLREKAIFKRDSGGTVSLAG